MSALQALTASWQRASRREQRSLGLAAVVVGAALLWWLALAPALNVWRSAPAQQQQIDAQLQQMLGLQAQARALQALPTLDAAAARHALDAALKPLGIRVQVATQMDRLTATLKGADAQALAQCLSASRQNAHLVPTEAHLKRVGTSWDGTLVFTLPAQ